MCAEQSVIIDVDIWFFATATYPTLYLTSKPRFHVTLPALKVNSMSGIHDIRNDAQC